MNYKALFESYLNWLRDNTEIESLPEKGIGKIIPPFLDRHNDHIEIYIAKNGDNYILSDDGYTISDLQMSGMEFNTKKRNDLLDEILAGFGIKRGNSNEIFVEANETNFGQKKHYLIQAMLAVNDMFSLAQESIYSFFKEDVEHFFNSNKIIYSKDIKITGKSGLDQNVDFLIPKSDSLPERLLKTINVPRKNNVMSAIFSFVDIQEARKEPIQSIAFYNDQEETPSKDILDAFKSYQVKSIPWKQRDNYINELRV